MTIEFPVGVGPSILGITEAIGREEWPAAYAGVMALMVAASREVQEDDGEAPQRVSGFMLGLSQELVTLPNLDQASKLAVLSFLAGVATASMMPEDERLTKGLAGLKLGNQAKGEARARWVRQLEKWMDSADWSRTNADLADAFRGAHPSTGAPKGDGVAREIARMKAARGC